MSANPLKSQHLTNPAQGYVSHLMEPAKRRGTFWQRSAAPETDDGETRFVAKATIWMLALALTPLVLFYILTYFDPDFFWIPIPG